ncbi:DUF2808 domain-containing protein [Kamptonema formosum]|uniref:DUF2808 domain-containing protein n=1 Tax=Kamptonema formosum TaxID=331992 RepID=UPI00034914A4|nr:DUF2808 domain-containing protein [Oscillatoria sp. PCC 10802]
MQNVRRTAAVLGASLALAAGSWVNASEPAPAVRLADGMVYFVEPPRLLSATTTQKATGVWGAMYYFTLSVPESAGEPLRQVLIRQREGSDTLEFDWDGTRAFEGTPSNRGARLGLAPVRTDRQARTVSVTFDPPVPPGSTVTVALRPVQNPHFSGIYLFGVTAYPAGEPSHGQFLGYGRFHFYSGGDSWF